GEVSNEFEQPDTNFGGTAVNVSYNHITESYGLYTNYRDFSPDFRADLGFISQVGLRGANVGSAYKWLRESGSWFNRISINPGYTYLQEHNGRMLQSVFSFGLAYSGPLQTSAYIYTYTGKQYYNGKTFDTRNLNFFTNIRPSGALNISISTGFSKRIDYSNMRPGNQFQIIPSVEYKFGTHLITQVGHNFQRMRVSGGRLYTANVSNARLVYQFNKRSFIRTNLQFVDYRYNTALYSNDRDPQSRRLGGQILYSYKVNPQTVFYLGYSSNAIGDQDIGLAQTNRTFFTKIGYAWLP
ncbi:MAG: hypothetical protein HOC71_19555, partial [Candidatus Latescibacteria bacterium]|nr:hypothetical protein [Candidatus Latescibacterota bacterium]